MKTVKFWHYVNDTDVLIKMREGQTLSHYSGGPTDEGWSSQSEQWHFDGELLHRESVSDGRDCDGRLTQGYTCICPASEAMAGNTVDGHTFPAWQDGNSYQRDEYAELSNY